MTAAFQLQQLAVQLQQLVVTAIIASNCMTEMPLTLMGCTATFSDASAGVVMW